MLGKANHKRYGRFTDVDHAARLTGDGIHQVVALTREGLLDVYLTLGTSDGGGGAQMGACFAPVSGAGDCARCGVDTAAEVGRYENITQVQIDLFILFYFILIYFESSQGLVTKGVFTIMPVRPENPADWEIVWMVKHTDDGSFVSYWYCTMMLVF